MFNSLKSTVKAGREVHSSKTAATGPSKGPINLLRGWPNPSLLPLTELKQAAQTTFSHPSVATDGLLYGPDEGYAPLRIEISKWLSLYYNCPDDPSRICVTGGASQNLACILQVFTDPSVTRSVWMVAPCYFLACRIFEDAGFAKRLRAVPEDGEGIDVEHLEREIRLTNKDPGMGKVTKPNRPWSKTYDHIIYVVSDFSNPSGKTMSLRRREQLVSLARTHNALIVSDDVYDRLKWPSTAFTSLSTKFLDRALLPRLTDIDRSLPARSTDSRQFGHTVSNGSFSKILGPGVRTGWVDAQPTFSFGLSQCGSSRSGGCPSQLVATMIAEVLSNKTLQEHINSVLIPSYARRWSKMMSAIEHYLVPHGVSVLKVSLAGQEVFGGYFIWFELPQGMSAERVAVQARDTEDLIVAHGNLFEVYGDEEAVKFHRWLRVCFAWEDEEKLVDGILRLQNVIRNMENAIADDEKGSGSASESLRALKGEF